jgi:hypothetical protein
LPVATRPYKVEPRLYKVTTKPLKGFERPLPKCVSKHIRRVQSCLETGQLGQTESTTDEHGLRDEAGEKRWRATAVQNLAETRSGLTNAKRLGVRQPSGALERGNHPDVAASRQAFASIEITATFFSVLSMFAISFIYVALMLNINYICVNINCKQNYEKKK